MAFFAGFSNALLLLRRTDTLCVLPRRSTLKQTSTSPSTRARLADSGYFGTTVCKGMRSPVSSDGADRLTASSAKDSVAAASAPVTTKALVAIVIGGDDDLRRDRVCRIEQHRANGLHLARIGRQRLRLPQILLGFRVALQF